MSLTEAAVRIRAANYSFFHGREPWSASIVMLISGNQSHCPLNLLYSQLLFKVEKLHIVVLKVQVGFM